MDAIGAGGRRPKLVGREGERSLLRAALREVLDGKGRLVLIAGEAGSGKTALAEEFSREALDENAMVAWGRCWRDEGAPDLWPWMQVVRSCMRSVDDESLRGLVGSHGGELSGLIASRGGESSDGALSPPSRFRRFNAIVHFLEAYSERTPLVVILENLHRADDASLRLLQFFTQEQGQRRIFLVGTYREPDTPNRALTQMLVETVGEPGAERLTLRSLTCAEGESLLRNLLASFPIAVAHALHERTGGNPLFLIECARQLRGRGEPGAPPWSAELPIPGEVREVLEQRLAPLSHEQRAVLASAAALGREFEAADLSPGADAGLVCAALAAAQSLGLLRPGVSPTGRRFTPEMLREFLAEEDPLPTAAESRQGAAAGVEALSASTDTPFVFRREGEYWTIAYGGETSRIKDAKGLAYVAFLLRQPHVEVHVSELVTLGTTVDDPGAERSAMADFGIRLGLGDAGAVLDHQAKAAYRTRLEELRAELAEAENFHDRGRTERARREIDFLTRELAKATGLGGRDRRAASAVERARVNVTRAIVRAIERVDENDRKLGAHLREAIRTGTFCAYAPGTKLVTRWQS